MTEPSRKPFITVFGAGITGLTAAHELAERGFRVEVIDPDICEEVHRRTRDRGIGGMARSQFACRLLGVPDLHVSPAHVEGEGQRPAFSGLRSSREFLLDDVLAFNPDLETPKDKAIAQDILDRLGRLVELLCENKVPLADLVMLVFEDSEEKRKNDKRVEYVRKELKKRVPERYKNQIGGISEQLTTAEAQQRNQYDYDPTMPTWVMFRVRNLELFPAEHGFRFFPSFYRHLFDTMRRTRILNPRPHERAMKTVRENLLASEGLGFARAGAARSFVLPRGKGASVELLRNQINLVLSELDYSLSDVERFGKKILKYLTSSTARRQLEYENMSWGDFVEQTRYSEASRKHIEYGPQMSAALRGSESDARTQGNITAQLMLDQLVENSQPDCTLNGPTNSAWFDHWWDYLRDQGVTFRRGRLKGFQANEKTGLILPVLEQEGGDEALDDPGTIGFVLALSLPAMAELAPGFEAAARQLGTPLSEGNDFRRVTAFAGSQLTAELAKAKPNAPLQHLSGIQFYFATEVQFWRGHTQYLDSEWGLTSIAQPQFWGRQRDGDDPYRSILSVDIGIWDRAYVPKDPTTDREKSGLRAWECTAEELARYAWEQIKDHHDQAVQFLQGASAQVPEPMAYFIDENIVFSKGQERPLPERDRSPFLVNKTGAFTTRPGALVGELPNELCPKVARGSTQPHRRGRLPVQHAGVTPQQSAYTVYHRYVMAGTFMKTYTRLTSMEGANESARHAVNALLEELDVACERCQIWDPETNELPALQWMRDLDQRLVEEGRPHVLDILGGAEDGLSLAATFMKLSMGGRR